MTQFSNVSIEMDTSPYLPRDYEEKHQFLSSKQRKIHVFYNGQKIYSTVVPKGVFNPYQGVAANKLIEIVLQKAVEVKNLRVVDLGCGSGVIGLACITMGCERVLFTDINPNIAPLLSHPLLRHQDRVKIQDLLGEEAPESCDVILTSTPTNIAKDGRDISKESYESGIFRTEEFLLDLIEESARCLTPGGTLAMWVKMPPEDTASYRKMKMKLGRYFSIDTMKVFWKVPESEVNVGEQKNAPNLMHLVFSIQKSKTPTQE